MFKKETAIFIMALMIVVALTNRARTEISIEPVGFAVSMEENQEVEIELVLINNGDEDTEFSIDYNLIDDEEERQNGPHRDDFGDVVGGFEANDDQWYGLAWDGELIWGMHYDDGLLHARTLEGEIVRELRLGVQGTVCLCWDGEAFWTTQPNADLILRFDLDGEILNSIEIGNDPVGLTWDGENLWYTPINGPFIRQISIEGEELRTLDLQNLENSRLSLTWIPEHNDPLWALHTSGNLYQLDIENDVVEVLQETDFDFRNQWGLTHDGEHLWITAPNRWNRIDDGTAEFHILEFDPEEGVIPDNDFEDISVLVSSEDLEDGIYNTLITVESVVNTIEISAVVSIDSPVATVTCGVSDAETEEAIEQVEVNIDAYSITRFTNENGTCDFENLPTGEYEFSFITPDYLPLSEPYRIDGEGELELRVELLHSECNLNRDEIAIEIEEGEQVVIPVEMSNNGNGQLTYSTDRRLIGDANADPWELRFSYNVGEITRDSRILGVVFVDEHLYLAGANNRDPLMYVVDREGEVISQYEQLGESNYGYKDLTWDGELIWGSGEREVFGFRPDGELVQSFNTEISPCTNLAWDSEREILWISSTTTNIFGYNRDGERISELDRHELRVYGLAFWPEDPDGYQLYIFHKNPDLGNFIISKINVENGEILDVTSLNPERGGAAQGCYITNQYDIYSWVLMACANNGAEDRIDLWQIDARKDWMEIEPTEGVIDPDDQQEFEITLDATGLPPAVFEGEIVFLHDGIGRETHLPISLQVGEGGGPEEMVIELNNSWNMVSTYLQPDPDDVRIVTAELVETGTLILMKNTIGQFYNPQFNFNNIPGWVVSEGYLIKMDGDDELTVNGMPVAPDDPIALRSGWQIVSYFPREPIDAVVALSGLGENLLMAKDGSGHFYNPAFNFSNIGDMIPGQGYLIKVNDEGELIYNLEDEFASNHSGDFNKPQLLPIHHPTSENMSLLILSEIASGEVGVYTKGKLVGSGVVQNGKCGIAVWGDDPSTPELDGALIGDRLDITFINKNGQISLNLEYIIGSGIYSPNDFQAIRLKEIITSPTEFGLVSIFPNPFNNRCGITYNLTTNSVIELSIFDLAGRKIIELDSGQKPAGQHTISIVSPLISSGVYIIQLKTKTGVSKRKLTLIK